jgi:phospholipid transport system transporter-binding protein
VIEHREGCYWLSGSVTMSNASALREDGLRQFAAAGLKGGQIGGGQIKGGQIEIDLSGVTEVDSSAISLLFEWERQLARKGTGVRLRNLGPNLRSLASVYEVLDLLPGN